jgi:hypothetical protein
VLQLQEALDAVPSVPLEGRDEHGNTMLHVACRCANASFNFVFVHMHVPAATASFAGTSRDTVQQRPHAHCQASAASRRCREF